MKSLPTFLLSLATLSFILLLSGCGQSGPLFVPGDPSKMAVPPETPKSEQTEGDSSDEE